MNIAPDSLATDADPRIFGRLAALTEPLRVRVLLILEVQELTVSELCAVFQVPQSTMSRQLKALVGEGWLVVRAEGPSRRYSMPGKGMAPEARRLWQVVREEVAGMSATVEDRQRLRQVLAERRTRSREFFSSVAGEWDRLRRELVGRRLDLLGLLGLVDEGWTVGDLGCGTGQLTRALAPFVARVVAIDASVEMLAAARDRLGEFPNVEVRAAELEDLPLGDGELDAAIVFLVLHYLTDPSAAVAEAHRVLRNAGKLLIVDLVAHDREDYRQRMGHVTLGFSSEHVEALLQGAGFVEVRQVMLPPEPDTKGPPLFAVTARKRE
jgi:ArsR family transcriptional regulator